MAQDCMALFEKEKLSDVASVEQVRYILLLEVIFATFIPHSVVPLVLLRRGNPQKVW